MASPGILPELGLIGLLLLLNGFFACAEIAVLSARRARIEALAEEGDRRAAAVLRLKQDPDRFLATVQVGVTVVGTLASAVGGVAAAERLEPALAGLPFPAAEAVAGPLAVGIVVAAIAYLSLVVGELVPKSLAVRNAEPLALIMARPVEIVGRIARPAVGLLTWSTGLLLGLFGQRKRVQPHFLSIEDLELMVGEAGKQGIIAPELLEGAIDVHDRQVREVMTPRQRVIVIPQPATVGEAVRIANESGHTRFPVVAGDLDHVVGFVHARELFERALADPGARLAERIRPVTLVPETKSAVALLHEMRASKTHMAVVLDEHGSTAGIVTLEDLLEVIVGDIPDEHREEIPRLVPVDGGWEVDASLPVHEVNEACQLELPEDPSYVSVGGLILERLGRLAAAGDRVDVGDVRITVLDVERRRVGRVRIEHRAHDVA